MQVPNVSAAKQWNADVEGSFVQNATNAMLVPMAIGGVACGVLIFVLVPLGFFVFQCYMIHVTHKGKTV